GPTSITVPAYTEACGGGTCIPQAGTTRTLDSLADRLMYRAAYRNFGDHESIVVNHAVTAGASVGVRWYELRGVTTTPTLFQSGTFAPDSNFRWMGSAAMDRAGSIAIGYSVSSSALKPQIRVTGRLAGDPAGQLTLGETTIVAGAGSQTGTLSRWGDYSSMSIDPVDDCTFYYATEYIPANGTFNWRTRIAAFTLTSCTLDFALSASPATLTLAAGATGTSTVTVTPTGGFAGSVALTVSGVPGGASATLAPPSTTSTSVLTVDAGTASPGTYPLTVTGTSGALTHMTTLTLTIPSPPPPADFSLSALPTTVTATQGGSGTTTITVTPQNGFNGSVDLSVTGLPANALASFNPTPTTDSSVLTLTIDAGTPVATYPLTVTGTNGGTPTHTTDVSLNVTTTTTPPAPSFSLSVSPTSLTVRRGRSGNYTVTVTRAGGFTGAVALSVTVPQSGVTSTFTPATVTGTGSTLRITASGNASRTTAPITITGTSPGVPDATTTATLTIR
ncbi:MAG TPA: hypothetical protein VKE51_10765, partial [Vicinamibacterales bacterium]|nr:hypothetical protein [Vicinamibacterales bacterium]